jgi:hypothetical protein
MLKSISCVIPSTRYLTTLPLTVQSILSSIDNPQQLLIYQDGEQSFDFNTHPLWKFIFTMASNKQIEVNVVKTGGGQGMVRCWADANRATKHRLIWRVDDDMVVEPTTLSLLCETWDKEKPGAISGIVAGPGQILPCPPWADGKMRRNNFCPQNHSNATVKDVEFLVSSYIYDKTIGSWYPLELSPMAHTEDIQHSHEIFRKGHKLIIDNRALTWHYSYPQGGCREMKDSDITGQGRQHDDNVFIKYCDERNIAEGTQPLVIPIGHGYGDAIVFRNVLDKILPYYKKPVYIATNFPKVFEGINGVLTCSFSDALAIGLNSLEISIYNYMARTNWKGHISDAYISMFTQDRENISGQ